VNDAKCRNCGLSWTEHTSDRWGPYCIRTYRPELPPDSGNDLGMLRRPWLATLTQRQVVLITRIAEAAVIAAIVSLLLAILNIRTR
jgi:hypothetical protein